MENVVEGAHRSSRALGVWMGRSTTSERVDASLGESIKRAVDRIALQQAIAHAAVGSRRHQHETKLLLLLQDTLFELLEAKRIVEAIEMRKKFTSNSLIERTASPPS